MKSAMSCITSLAVISSACFAGERNTTVTLDGLRVEVVDNSMRRGDADRVMRHAMDALYSGGKYHAASRAFQAVVTYSRDYRAGEATLWKAKSLFKGGSQSYPGEIAKLFAQYPDSSVVKNGDADKVCIKMLQQEKHCNFDASLELLGAITRCRPELAGNAKSTLLRKVNRRERVHLDKGRPSHVQRSTSERNLKGVDAVKWWLHSNSLYITDNQGVLGPFYGCLPSRLETVRAQGRWAISEEAQDVVYGLSRLVVRKGFTNYISYDASFQEVMTECKSRKFPNPVKMIEDATRSKGNMKASDL